MLILGFGSEGESTYRFLRSLYPRHVIGIADEKLFEELSHDSQDKLPSDSFVRLHLGSQYRSSLSLYDVIIKGSTIDLTGSETDLIASLGKTITSQAEIFFFNCPGKIVGITNDNATKHTAKIIHKSLISAKFDSCLVGNTSLHLLKRARTSTVFIFDLRLQILKGFKQSPHIAVILNQAKAKLERTEVLKAYQNLVIHQSDSDYLIHDPSNHAAQQIGSKSKGTRIHYSGDVTLAEGCFIDGHQIRYRTQAEQERISLDLISEGSYNSNYDAVLSSITVCKALGVEWPCIIEAMKNLG